MKIVILGGGIAAHRYVESLIWSNHELTICGFEVTYQSKKLSEEYGLPYISFHDLTETDMKDVDMTIVCLSISRKYDVISHLINKLNYRNSMILEKPLCILKEDCSQYQRELGKLRNYAVVCQRDFDRKHYQIEKSESYTVKWFSILDSLKLNVINMLPHLLSWLILEIGDEIELKVIDGHLEGSIKNQKLTIEFEQSRQCIVEINDVVYKSPNYRKLNGNIVDTVYDFSESDSADNLERAIKAVMIMSKVLEELEDD